MNILNNIILEGKDKEFFDKAINSIEQLESIEMKYSVEVEKSLYQMFKKLEKAKTGEIARATEELITILNRLSFKIVSNILHFLDHNHCGLSFHFVMESKNLASQESISNIDLLPEENTLLRTKSTIKQLVTANEYAVFYNRLVKIRDKGLLKYIYAPMRHRLIGGLLEEDEDDEDTLTSKNTINQTLRNKLINNDFYNWFQHNNSEESINLLDKNINIYIAKQQEKYLNLTLIPKYLEEKIFLNIINNLELNEDSLLEDEDYEEDDEYNK